MNYKSLVPCSDLAQEYTVRNMNLSEPSLRLKTDMTVSEAMTEMKNHNVSQCPVYSGDKVVGFVTPGHISTKVIKRKVTLHDMVEKCLIKDFRHVSSSTTMNEMNRVLTRHSYVLVDNKYVATSMDVMTFLNEHKISL